MAKTAARIKRKISELEEIPGIGPSAVYYASNARHDPEKLKWWNWKNVFSDDARGKR